jgi:signal transduction histidine kinase
MALSLKDFSRLDRAPVAKYDVNEGLDRTLLIAKNALKHKVEIIKQYGEVGKITCSPSQINQVFLNLITNAAQAIEEQGDIAITTSQDDESVRITVADNGCGIPEHILEKIRDPFFTTKQVGEGTGLGLAIVEKIINSHGGKLHIESEVGKGSAFTVVLPRQAQDQSVGDDDDFQEEAVAMAV